MTSDCVPLRYMKRVSLNLILSSISFMAMGQTTTTPANTTTDIKGTKTDKQFSNTTVIYKKEGGNDANILDQVADQYGIGDVVRITVAPPPPPPVEAMNNSANVKPQTPQVKPAINIPSTTKVAEEPPKPEPIYAFNETKKPNVVIASKTPNATAQTPLVDTQYGAPVDVKKPSVTSASEGSKSTAQMKEKETEKAAKTAISTTSSSKTAKSSSVSKNNNSRSNYRTNSRLIQSNKKKGGFFSFLFGKKSVKKPTNKGDKKYGCYKF